MQRIEKWRKSRVNRKILRWKWKISTSASHVQPTITEIASMGRFFVIFTFSNCMKIGMTSDKLYAHTNVSADDFPSSFLTLLLIHCRLILACGQWNVFRLISRQVGARTMAQRFDDVIIILHISYVVCFTHDDMKLFFLAFPFPMNSSMAKTTANRSWKLCRWIKNFRLFLLTFLTLLDPRPLAQMKTNMKQISCCVFFAINISLPLLKIIAKNFFPRCSSTLLALP